MPFLSHRARAVTGILLLSSALAGSAIAASPAVVANPTPPARLSDLARPISYDLQLTVVPSADKFSGHVVVEVEVLQPTQVLWLHAVRLDVHRAQVSVAGKILPARVVVTHDAVGLRLAQAVPAGRATLTLDYDGGFERQTQEGLMKIHEQDDWYVASNFEPHYARRMVPSFDELRAKAPWKLTLEVPVGAAAFANAPEVSEEAISPTMKRVHFATTAPIASYVLALAVGPFDVVEAAHGGRRPTPIRILVPRGTAAMAHYAAEATGRIVDISEDAVGEPYPYEKLDILALPGIDHFGAMENVGLITMQADLVLAQPGHEDVSFQRRYASTAAHEIAHMWFGNWVTPAGWNDLWLNEGFADWMTPKTLQRFNPLWQQELETDDARAQGLLTDRLLGVHPMRLKDDLPESAEAAFDPISYGKASSVLRMVEHWMGEERFRDGVKHYLTAHANGSVTAEDLYAALSASADPHVSGEVTPMLQSFVDQPGAPGLEVALQCPEPGKDGVKLDLNQFRFAPRAHVNPALAAGQAPAALHWVLPVCFQYGEGGDYGETCTLMRDPHAALFLPEGERCPDWVVANTDGFTYLLPLLRDPLTAALDHAPLLPNEAVPVLDDARVLLSSDAIGADNALALAARFANQRQPLVILASARLARALPGGLIDGVDVREAYTRFLRKAYGPRAEALGWLPKQGEREVDDLLRQELVPMVADLGLDQLLRSEAERLAREALAGRTELGPQLSRILDVAVISAGQDTFDNIAAAAAKAPSPTRVALYRSLGHFRDAHLLDEALDLALNEKVDVRDGVLIIEAASSDAANQVHAFDYLKAHFDAVTKRYGNALDYLSGAAEGFCDRAERADLDAFVAERAAKIPQIHANFATSYEKADLCEAGKELQGQRLKDFFAKQANERQ